MNKKIVSLMILSCFAVSGAAFAEKGEKKAWHTGQKEKRKEHHAEQHQENKEFRQSLKGKTGQEKAEAIKSHHDSQFAENKAFREKMHSENSAFLKEKLANNKNLTDAQKNELVSAMESQYQGNQAFRDQQHSENTAFLQGVANDAGMTQEQRRQAIKDHFAKQRSEAKAHFEENKASRKALKDSIKNTSVTASNTSAN